MIKIETVTALISTTANWDVRKPQEIEQQPHMLRLQFVCYITLQEAAFTGFQTVHERPGGLCSVVLTCTVKEQGVRKLFHSTKGGFKPLSIIVETHACLTLLSL